MQEKEFYDLCNKHGIYLNAAANFSVKCQMAQLENLIEDVKKSAQLDKGGQAEVQVSFAEPNQQLFTMDELRGYLSMQRMACVKTYNKYCKDRQLPISDTCRQLILRTADPEIVKS